MARARLLTFFASKLTFGLKLPNLVSPLYIAIFIGVFEVLVAFVFVVIFCFGPAFYF